MRRRLAYLALVAVLMAYAYLTGGRESVLIFGLVLALLFGTAWLSGARPGQEPRGRVVPGRRRGQ